MSEPVSRRYVEVRPLPDKPRPIAHGFESIDWRACPLAQRHGIPGETRSRRKGKLP